MTSELETDPLADERRTDRGLPALPSGDPAFSDTQRLWLLERDLDNVDDRFDEFKMELQLLRREQRAAHEKLNEAVGEKLDKVNGNLWRLVGVGFAVLTAVLAVLVTVISNSS